MRSFAAIIATAAALAWSGQAAAAQTYKVLYSFCAQANCTDGASPYAGVILDKSENLFGTTQSGGSANSGTIFELVHVNNGRFEHKVLYSFCAVNNQCPDGKVPQGNLIIDTNGNLYGTARGGGTGGDRDGTVFKLRKTGGKWEYRLLYTFNGPDGAGPDYLTYAAAQSGQAYDGSSPLYVVTKSGSGTALPGVIAALQPGPGMWHYKSVYVFCQTKGCLDGSGPNPGLAFDPQGNIYGTTQSGGAGPNAHEGIIFKLSPERIAKEPWSEVDLHDFCQIPSCTDGAAPASGVIGAVINNQFTLFGVTSQIPGGSDQGSVAYQLVPQGVNSPYQLQHSFCTPDGCNTGANAAALPAFDPSKNLIGTTAAGSSIIKSYQAGAVYKLIGNQYSLLHGFCLSCADGSVPSPAGPLAIDSAGNVFGTTWLGGASNQGVVYGLVSSP